MVAPFTQTSVQGRVVAMAVTLVETSAADFEAAGRLLHDFNREYDEPVLPAVELADRLTVLVGEGHLTVLLTRDPDTWEAIGIAVLRVQPSVCSADQEAYLAELYVVPPRRGQGYGRELITEALSVARGRGAGYAFLITSEEDRLAQRLYEAAGFRRTEGEGGPLMLAYERDL